MSELGRINIPTTILGISGFDYYIQRLVGESLDKQHLSVTGYTQLLI